MISALRVQRSPSLVYLLLNRDCPNKKLRRLAFFIFIAETDIRRNGHVDELVSSRQCRTEGALHSRPHRSDASRAALVKIFSESPMSGLPDAEGCIKTRGTRPRRNDRRATRILPRHMRGATCACIQRVSYRYAWTVHKASGVMKVSVNHRVVTEVAQLTCRPCSTEYNVHLRVRRVVVAVPGTSFDYANCCNELIQQVRGCRSSSASEKERYRVSQRRLQRGGTPVMEEDIRQCSFCRSAAS